MKNLFLFLALTFGIFTMNSCTKEQLLECQNLSGVQLCSTTWMKDPNSFPDTVKYTFTNIPFNNEFRLETSRNDNGVISNENLNWMLYADSTLKISSDLYKVNPVNGDSIFIVDVLNKSTLLLKVN